MSGKLTEEWRGENETTDIQILLDDIIIERKEFQNEKILKKRFGKHDAVAPLNIEIPSNWKWVCFDEISANTNNALKAGPFGSALKKSDCTESGYRIYGQEQVIAGNENLVSYYVNDEKYQQLSACSVGAGDILISLVGTIGKVLILSENVESGVINPRLVKLTLNPSINRKFIKNYLDSPIAKEFFKGFSHGGTMNILNLGILRKLPLAIAPIDEQTEIVRRVEDLFAFADKVEEQVNEAQTRVNNLTQSILAKAFRGELTADWRAANPELISGDNSAEALLERIKVEREALAIKKKPSKKTKVKNTA